MGEVPPAPLKLRAGGWRGGSSPPATPSFKSWEGLETFLQKGSQETLELMRPGAMTQIKHIEWIGVRVPFRRPLVTTQVTAEHRYALLLLMGTDAGVTGLGEASPVGAGSPAEIRRTAELLTAWRRSY